MKVLVVVDMQNDFITGSLGTKEAQGIVENVVKKIKTTDADLILFTQDTHGEDYLNTPEGKKLPVVHCVQNTEGWELHPQIKQAWIDKKNNTKITGVPNNSFHKSVFGSPELVSYIKNQAGSVAEIELIGVCTDICVVTNALLLKTALPEVTVKVDSTCCAGVTPESHEAALVVMQMCQVDILT